MKRLIYFSLLLFIAQACKEVAPIIPTPNVDSDRKVLMEEFSGGNCKPCAVAKADIDNLLTIYGENLIVVTMHTNFFASQGGPSPGAIHDFRTDEGTHIMESLGLPFGIPSSYINRRVFEGEPDRPLGKTQWAGYVAQAIDEAPDLGMNLTHEYDATTRELKANITMVPSSNIDADIRLHVLITENHILDKQTTDDGIVDNYSHDHIFRTMLSSVDGDKIIEPFVSGEVIEKNYTFTIPEEDILWVAENCNVVAYVTINDGEVRNVLQADEVHLGE